MFKLCFPIEEIGRWAAQYSYPGEDRIVERLAPAARARGYLRRAEFLELCKWKSPRTQPRCAENTAGTIGEADLHKAELLANLGLARQGKPLNRIGLLE
jgi:hypothetical protein